MRRRESLRSKKLSIMASIETERGLISTERNMDTHRRQTTDEAFKEFTTNRKLIESESKEMNLALRRDRMIYEDSP